MRCEAISNFLVALSKQLSGEDALLETKTIKHIHHTNYSLSSHIEVLCRALCLVFEHSVDEKLHTHACLSIVEVLSWSYDKEQIFDIVDSFLERGNVEQPNVYLIQSIFLQMSQDFESAFHWAHGALRISKSSGQKTQRAWAERILACIYVGMGENLMHQGKLRAAETAYKRATKLLPEFDLAWSNLGHALRERGKLTEATTAYNRAIKIKGVKSPESWIGMADIYFKQNYLEKAEYILKDLIKSNSKNPAAYNLLGLVQSAQGNFFLAISSFKKALLLSHPRMDMTWNNLGVAYKSVFLYEKAIAAFLHAITLKPQEKRQRRNLIYLYVKLGRMIEAAQHLREFLVSQVHKSNMTPLIVARDFIAIIKDGFLTCYDLVTCASARDKPPGSGKHIIDHYLVTVQQALVNGVKNSEFYPSDAVRGLLYIGTLWCFYAEKLGENLSKKFVREQIYIVKQNVIGNFEKEAKVLGFFSAWSEIEARIGTTTPEEFAQEMLRQEPVWLQSVGIEREHGEIEDLRWRLNGNLWIHVFEYQREQREKLRRQHLERVHYYMELLKGHTVLHKLADSKIMRTTIDMKKWNRYVSSLPVKIDKTTIIDLKGCTKLLPSSSVVLSFYFLHRELIDDTLLSIVSIPGQEPYLRTVTSTKRFEEFQNIAKRLKQVHHQVAWREKVSAIGNRFYDLLGVEKEKRKRELKGMELIRSISEWEKDQLRKAYRMVLEDVIDLKKIRGKDLYISPSPIMYDIPFGLLMKGDEFLNQIVNSITIVPVFSLRQFKCEGYFPDKHGLVLCLDKRWENEAEKRAKKLGCSWCDKIPHQKIEHGLSLPSFEGNTDVKYNEWIRAISEVSKTHIIAHHDASQWSHSTERNPNLGQFGRYLYEAPEKLSAEVLSLETCWGGTWSNPEDMMGLFVSFLSSGVSHIIASPYSVVPTATSGKLFDRIYEQSLETDNGNVGLQIARALRAAEELVRQDSLNSDDTIPTLWGALQLYASP